MKVEITKEIIKAINTMVNYDYSDEMKHFWGELDDEDSKMYDLHLEKEMDNWRNDVISPESFLKEIQKSSKHKYHKEHIFYSLLVAEVYLEYVESLHTTEINELEEFMA